MNRFSRRRWFATAGVRIGKVRAQVWPVGHVALRIDRRAGIRESARPVLVGLSVRLWLTALPRFRSGVKSVRRMMRENTGFLLAQVNANREMLLTDDKLHGVQDLRPRSQRKARNWASTSATGVAVFVATSKSVNTLRRNANVANVQSGVPGRQRVTQLLSLQTVTATTRATKSAKNSADLSAAPGRCLSG